MQRRLGVAPRSIGSYAWGLAKTYQVSNEKVKLADDPEYNVYDIKDIPNPPQYPKTWANNDEDVLDAVDGDARGFKRYGSSDVRSRVGFITLDKDLGPYSEGDTIPYGMYETLLIIKHRNKVLRDSGINMVVPATTMAAPEKANLDTLIAQANAAVSYGGHYYWPAASYAYAYQPTVNVGETLSDKFKPHKWFLPAPGDGFRLSFYMRHAGVEESEYRIFDEAIKKLDFVVPTRVPTTGESYNSNECIMEARPNSLYGGCTNIYTESKASALAVRPIVQF